MSAFCAIWLINFFLCAVSCSYRSRCRYCWLAWNELLISVFLSFKSEYTFLRKVIWSVNYSCRRSISATLYPRSASNLFTWLSNLASKFSFNLATCNSTSRSSYYSYWRKRASTLACLTYRISCSSSFARFINSNSFASKESVLISCYFYSCFSYITSVSISLIF